MIFCVEDDASVRDIEIYTLQSTGFKAEGFADGASFFKALKEETPDLILLDVMLPGEDGVSILRKLKSNPATRAIPVIMATAKGAEFDKVRSLDIGADDYLVKPFGMMELVARVKAVLRRVSPAGQENQEPLQQGGLILNPTEHTVTANNSPVELTLKEFELLQLFMTHPRRVFSRNQLLSEVWETDYYGETRTVDVHIRTLRQKLGDCGDLIETVRGIGYRMKGQEK